MFRKLTVLICLLSFCPAAVGAQELATNSAIVTDQQSGQLPLNKEPDLSPQVINPAYKTAAAEAQKINDVVKAEEPKKVKSSSLTLNEWAEIHFGDNRWIWWVGGAAVLVALHAFVFVK